MNRVFYAMIAIAFTVAAFYQVTDPPVQLSTDDRAALVQVVDTRGPDAVVPWLKETSEERNVRLAEQRANASWIGQVRLWATASESDLVGDIAYSGGIAPSALDRAVAEAAEGETGGEAVVAALEEAGDFTFGEAGTIKGFNDGLFDMAKAAVMGVVIPLIGAMAFFLGLMKIVEEAGAMKVIARLLRPVLRLLFPSVPADHPAMDAMILNMAANALGLGNAATPFGIKAMQELDKLNKVKGTATNAMCLFLAINTSAISLLPTGVIAIREALGSTRAADIMGTTLAATVLSTTAAIVVAKTFERFSPDPVPEPGDDEGTEVTGDAAEATETRAVEDEGEYPLWVTLLLLAGLVFVIIPGLLLFGQIVGPWVVPLLVVGFTTYGVFAGVRIYEAFVEGAKEGWQIGVRIVPFLVAILGAVGMLRGSGAIDLFVEVVGPVTNLVGMPPEALPMALLRPLSGSGAYGVMMATMTEYGPDSYIGYLVSTLQGSTETTFYVIAVYFGAIQVKRIRHAMVAALTADFVGISAAVAAVSAYFYFTGL